MKILIFFLSVVIAALIVYGQGIRQGVRKEKRRLARLMQKKIEAEEAERVRGCTVRRHNWTPEADWTPAITKSDDFNWGGKDDSKN